MAEISPCASAPLLQRYVDGALDDVAAVTMSRHLDTCSRCQDTLATMRPLHSTAEIARQPDRSTRHRNRYLIPGVLIMIPVLILIDIVFTRFMTTKSPFVTVPQSNSPSGPPSPRAK